MIRFEKLYLLLAIISGLIGFLGARNALANGFGKALFGVFLILYLISVLFGHDEKPDRAGH